MDALNAVSLSFHPHVSSSLDFPQTKLASLSPVHTPQPYPLYQPRPPPPPSAPTAGVGRRSSACREPQVPASASLSIHTSSASSRPVATNSGAVPCWIQRVSSGSVEAWLGDQRRWGLRDPVKARLRDPVESGLGSCRRRAGKRRPPTLWPRTRRWWRAATSHAPATVDSAAAVNFPPRVAQNMMLTVDPRCQGGSVANEEQAGADGRARSVA